MKTRKLVLGVLLSATICGSVFAASVEDRKNFCEKYPDKYVWVSKTEACIPVNPCLSSDVNIRASYCIPDAPYKADIKMMARHLEENYNDQGIEAKELESDYVAVKTGGGNYFVFKKRSSGTSGNSEVQDYIDAACWTIGFSDRYGVVETQLPANVRDCTTNSIGLLTEINCKHVAAYASHDKYLCEGALVDDNIKCRITCEEKLIMGL